MLRFYSLQKMSKKFIQFIYPFRVIRRKWWVFVFVFSLWFDILLATLYICVCVSDARASSAKKFRLTFKSRQLVHVELHFCDLLVYVYVSVCVCVCTGAKMATVNLLIYFTVPFNSLCMTARVQNRFAHCNCTRVL